ncbi:MULTISPECIES: hypothetical protein [unclassified Thioalkalivibrio]|uniref:hypothetical protein n=1 Tax=unclassified Thioalkalivibrio TaxID=2621013 RepID=UPI00036EC2ED|nr:MULTISPECIES: hypothetical protein [unclassified Thioalkalivibrio]
MRLKLELTVGEMRFALGLAIQHWTAKVKGAEGLCPVRNVTIALLLRYLDKHPEHCPVLDAPDMREVQKVTGLSNQELSLALGCHSTAAVRWLNGTTKPSQPVARLAHHIMHEANRGRLSYWLSLVQQEAELRGLGDIMERDTWSTDNPVQVDTASGASMNLNKTPVLGFHLGAILTDLNLTVEEVRQALGVTMPIWGKAVNKQPREAVSPPIAILFRYLKDNPERWPIEEPPTVDELMEMTGLGVYEIGIALGKQMVSGRRWKNEQSAYSPAVARLAVHLRREAEAGRFEEWVDMVNLEARVRGIDDIWKTRTWNKKKSSNPEKDAA